MTVTAKTRFLYGNGPIQRSTENLHQSTPIFTIYTDLLILAVNWQRRVQASKQHIL